MLQTIDCLESFEGGGGDVVVRDVDNSHHHKRRRADIVPPFPLTIYAVGTTKTKNSPWRKQCREDP